jgi:hypothetical protein
MSTIRRYTKIIISALARNIFPKYIHTPNGERLCRIIKSLGTLLGCKTWLGVLMVGTFLCMRRNPMKGKQLQQGNFITEILSMFFIITNCI